MGVGSTVAFRVASPQYLSVSEQLRGSTLNDPISFLYVTTLFLQVLFSKAAEEQIRSQAKEEKDNRKREAAKMLENTIDLINQVRLYM